MRDAAAPAFSVVVPVYNEAGNVAPLCAEIREVMEALEGPFEIIFVNDGSADATLEQLRALAAVAPCLRILDLDGNFGEAAALSAGFRAARAPIVITLDGDGQNDPRDIPRLLQTLAGTGCKAVSGWRQERQEGLWLRVLPSRLANRLIAVVTRIPVHDNGCGLKVYRRSVVEHMQLPRGMNRFMPAVFGVAAHEVAEVPVTDRRRRHGQSHYGIGRTVVVLRDLLALRFIIGGARRSESVAATLGFAAATATVYAVWQHRSALAGASALGFALTLMVWWNLRRFNRAQRHGVYRLRREYGGRSAASRALEHASLLSHQVDGVSQPLSRSHP